MPTANIRGISAEIADGDDGELITIEIDCADRDIAAKVFDAFISALREGTFSIGEITFGPSAVDVTKPEQVQ